ncbi:stage V sporulation protein E [Clostridium perfringens]|uniref:Probable peptidoglycan glycosyltransferase FtsW n=1 Tax=Clostridium perfringens (strain SM101 / Type A) TaxID=289380 RepID=Q0SRW5_CLOPS|nr:stage V sporulation protein E [Clostridium perfringens]ABG86726.1 stage V sporulation protein E [Clostridium perfringens SM101]EJT5916847.1 stage V sporulation protein E [Clostridium perfringens]EJT5925196.1 stage V sporulation protein E [Clostridium perfringens]EJT5938483.1 stage V sporulation protein E [Clostridium perfringens]EJT6135519.1 stage V sporulation protein E [Clostridium perfringens]
MKNKKTTKKSNINPLDYGLLYTIVILLAIGVVMVYSASSYFAMVNYNDSTAFLKKQALFAAIGFTAMIFISRCDYHKLKKLTGILFVITPILLVVVYLFPATKGAQRWIKLGPFSFQPSELAKYAVVIILANIITNKGEKIKEFWKGIVPCFIVGGGFAALILAQKNLSIAAVTGFVTFIMVFVAGARKRFMFGVITPLILFAGSFFTLFEDYRRRRLLNFINPWKDPAGDGYQLIQSFYALGAGGVTGLGIGQSRQKTLYMPEPHNDFIFAIIGEELGLIGCTVVILLFVIFVYRGIKIAMNAKDEYGTLLAVGITSIIGLQAIINIAVVTGSMPVTGVPLPFISYGGTALVFNLMAMGILLNISRQRNKKID